MWFLRITGELTGDGVYDILCAPHAASGKYQPTASYDAVRRHQNSGGKKIGAAPPLRRQQRFFGNSARDRLWRAAARFGALP